MKNLNFRKTRRLPANKRMVAVIGAAAILAVLVLVAIGSVHANDAEGQQKLSSADGGTSRILLAATDAHAAEAKDKKEEKAAAPAGPAPSKFWIVNTLRSNVALVIFLTLALGYFIGGIKLGRFSLGAVTGTLLVGVLIGQMDITISAHVKSVFFVMFLFAVGYSVGPQFVQGVAKDGAPQAIFAVLICVICLVVTWMFAKIAGYDVGLAAGMYSGAQTISASIGLATDAINNAGLSNAKEMLNQIPVAYAITYLFGTIGTGMILAYLGPTLIGANLQEACKQYEAEMSKGQPEGGMESAWHQLQMRSFEITAESAAVGKTVKALERTDESERLFIERIRRGDEIIEFDPNTSINVGDVVAVSGSTETLVGLEKGAVEVADKELLDVPVESVDLVVTRKEANGKTILELSKEEFTRGVYLSKITRGATSVDVPILAQTTIQRGDILKISGTKTHIARVEEALGYADRPSNMTDMVWVGLFILVSGLLGALSVKVGGVPITISVSGGVLIGGLVLGWLRSVHPTFGRLPAPTAWFMNSVGLNVFIAIVGISAGPGFVAGLKTAGVGLFLWGAAATAIPMLLAPFIGKYIFKFHPAILLGVCGGARTSTASVAMVGDKAKSNVPMLGYTVPYAVSNTLLTLNGMIIVLMMV